MQHCPSCISIDYDINPEWALNNFNGTCIQGGIDPKILLTDKNKIIKEAKKYLDIFKHYPYIFNLGHGMLPETNPESVKILVEYVKGYK